jgi:hypothetical protein
MESVGADASTNRVQLAGSMSRADVLAALFGTDFVVHIVVDASA